MRQLRNRLAATFLLGAVGLAGAACSGYDDGSSTGQQESGGTDAGENGGDDGGVDY